jgi:hypothetical protein
MSAGSTVPASALWMIYENLVRLEIRKVRFLILFVLVGIASLVLTIKVPN